VSGYKVHSALVVPILSAPRASGTSDKLGLVKLRADAMAFEKFMQNYLARSLVSIRRNSYGIYTNQTLEKFRHLGSEISERSKCR
jgi:hypothetical protein